MTQYPEHKEKIIEALNAAFSHRYQSVAQYVLDAHPYVRSDDAPLLSDIQEFALSDRAEAEHLADLIEALEGIPLVSVYDHDIAELNYLSLAYLRGVLKKRFEKELADTERQIRLVEGCPEAHTALLDLREALRGRIERLASCSQVSL